MHRSTGFNVARLGALLGGLLAAASTCAQQSSGWEWMVEPYAWAASIGTDMRTITPPTDADSDSSFSDVIDKLDGVFMGPSDLSLTLSAGKEIAATADWLNDPIRRLADRANAAGKVAGAFAVNSARGRFFIQCGYRLIALGADQTYLAEGAKAMLAAVKSS